MPWTILVVLLALAGGAAALGVATAGSGSGSSGVPGVAVVSGDAVPTVSSLGPTSFVDPGPFAAGEATITLPSDGAPVEIWYPAPPASARGRPQATYNVATWLPPALKALLPPGFGVRYRTGAYRGLPVASGRFPLVLFSHGFAGFRDQSTFLTSRLATWGFVVAAPDYLATDLTAVLGGHLAASTTADVREGEAAIALMVHENARHVGPWSGHLDLSRVAAIGHSLGGEVSEQLASIDPEVTTFVGMAGASVGGFAGHQAGVIGQVPHKPGMLMVGTKDQVASPAGIAKAYHDLRPPKRLVTLEGAGHLVFSDICQLAPGQGGLLGVAAQVHITVPPALVPLASDGCQSTDLPVTRGWPAIRQAVTAQLRMVFGFDPTAAGLTGLRRAFPGVVAVNDSVGTH
ncbi:MAG: alpha/beta hydrolase family protein [Acidimicrobiales bacterium]